MQEAWRGQRKTPLVPFRKVTKRKMQTELGRKHKSSESLPWSPYSDLSYNISFSVVTPNMQASESATRTPNIQASESATVQATVAN